MFESFFPKPKLFFSSAVLWSLGAMLVWYGYAEKLSGPLGFGATPEGAPEVVGPGFFITPEFLWFYVYYAICTALFGGFWWYFSRTHRWQLWSIWGSAFIIFLTYFTVQIHVAINVWRRPFGDTLQNALPGDKGVTPWDLYSLLIIFFEIAMIYMALFIVNRFFVSHYIFRWRTAMNDYYVSKWGKVRHIEGASQRIQEDTMRFARIMEDLGVSMIDAVMTLIAFLPVLFELSVYVKELPIIGAIPAPLFVMAIFWALFGTGLMAMFGIKLPGLEFHIQRVEAAYRKELVYGEDHHDRADPVTLEQLFVNVRRNYFGLYFHYIYFNLARSFYSNADSVFGYIILVPTMVSGAITYGILQQILTAFNQVTSSFQYLVSSWQTIVELLSIYKRLRGFEKTIGEREGKPPSGGGDLTPEPAR